MAEHGIDKDFSNKAICTLIEEVVATARDQHGIRLQKNAIQQHRAAYIENSGCEDCLLFILNLFGAQQIDKKAAHLVLLDFKSAFDCFDTVRYEQFLETLRDGFGIHGHASRVRVHVLF